MGMTKDLEDMTAETFSMMVIKTYGKEIEELYHIGSDGRSEGRALLQGEHRGALRQELDVSTDLLDLGTEPNPWWSAGVQQEHLREAGQLAMEQPMWTPREEVSVKEDLPEIEDADALRELEPLQTMGRMSAPPSSWSTRRGVALQTQGARPPNDDEDDLRHPGQGRRPVHPQGVERDEHHQGVGRKGHPQGVERAGHHQGVGQDGRHQGVEQVGHHQGVAAALLAGEVQRSGKGRSEGNVVRPNGMGGEIPSHGVARQGAQTGGLGGETPVQRSEGIMQEAGHHQGLSHGDRPSRSEVNMQEAGHHQGVSHGDRPSKSEVNVQRTGRHQGVSQTGHHRGVSHGYGPERCQVQGHRTVPSGLRDQSQRRGHRQDDGQSLERVPPMGAQQYEMRRQMPREASRQPQGEVQGTRSFVDDVNQQRRDERDELKRALEQSMVEELHRQKKHAEDLQRQHDEMEKKNEELQKELKKKSSSVEPPRTPPRRPQYYSLSPQTRITPGGTQVPPGQPPLDPADLPELPPWQFDPRAVNEHVGGGTGFDGLEDFWTPVDQQQQQQQQQQQHRPEPRADRFSWLEREVRMMHGERPALTGEYWERPVHRHGGPPADFG